MMQLHKNLAQQIEQAIKKAQEAGALPAFSLDNLTIQVQRPRHRDKGDFAAATAMQMARLARMAPLKIAQAIVDHLPPAPYLESAEVAPPGFINFRLTQSYVQNIVADIENAGMSYGNYDGFSGKKAQVEFVSANPTGPITIGRTRGGVIGDALSSILQAAGYDVTREYYYNDAGNQIRMLGESVQIRYRQLLGEAVKLSENHYQGGYIREIAQGILDQHEGSWLEAPIQQFGDIAKDIISAEQKQTLARINIVFDVFYNEQDLYSGGRITKALEELMAKDMAYEKDGAVWFKSTALGDEKDRVLIKSTGEPAYRMADIAYHWHKAERGFDLVVDIFGPDHHATAQTVLQGVQALGYSPDFVHTLIHQVVSLIRDGKQVKMSTRRAQYVTLDELIDEVGSDAVRFFTLHRSANSPVEFNLDLAVEQSDKNPVFYIQNAHVRCAGIFRKWVAAGNDLADADNGDLSLLTNPYELAFLKKATELTEIIELAATTYEPHHLTFYAYDLAASFHPTYEHSRVLHTSVSPDLQRARLRFYRAAQQLFARVLTLMGMSAPEKM